MQALKLLGQQMAKIWNQLGINQKVVLVASGLAVLALLSGLVYWSSRTEYTLLYGRLDPEEAGRMMGALEEMAIPHKTGAGGQSIYVPYERKDEARAKLSMKGMPKAEGVGFEIFDKPAFGMSDFVQQKNFMRALQGELARTIAWYDGVEQARVIINKPENRLLVDPTKQATASVALKLRGNRQIDPKTVEAIRSLVANAVEGLKPGKVSVTDSAGNLLSDSSDEGSLTQLGSTQLGARRSAERYLAQKVQSMLEKVVGLGQVVVEVSAEINTDTITKTDEVYDPAKALAKTETQMIETSNSVTPNPGGTPGTTINSNVDTNSPSFQMMGNSTYKTNNVREFAISRSQTNMVQIAGGLKRVTASVMVNTNNNPFFASANVDGQLKDLTRIVYNALGVQVGMDISRNTEVALVGVSFNKQQELQLSQDLEKDRKTEMLWSAGRSFLYVLLGAAALIGFWKLVRNSTEELLPTGIPVGQLIGGQLVYEAPVGQGGMGMPMMPSGAVQSIEEQKVEEAMAVDEDVEELQAAKSKLVMDFGLGQQAPERITIEVLKQLIKENPAKMSQAARIWMSRKAKEEEV